MTDLLQPARTWPCKCPVNYRVCYATGNFVVLYTFQNGKKLATKDNPGCENVSEEMRKLNNLWSKLLKCSSEKSVRLNQAAEQLKLNQLLEDEKLWLNDMETLLSSCDVGETLMDVKFLLRKQQVQKFLAKLRKGKYVLTGYIIIRQFFFSFHTK